MKIRLIALSLAFMLVLAPCCSTVSAPLVNNPFQANESPRPRVLSLTEDNFYVRIQLLVFAEQEQRYPIIFKSLYAALTEWESLVPVRFDVFQDVTYPNARLRYGIIQIHVTDLQSIELQKHHKTIGLWDPENLRIYLDADRLHDKPLLVYSTIMHEMGHMFGLPHVTNRSDNGYTGFIIMERSEDRLMYPASNSVGILSDAEIDIARHYVKYIFTTKPISSIGKCEFWLDNDE